MSEFQPISNMEKSFTVGKVEKPVEQKILSVAEQIKKSGIFKKDNSETEQKRTNKVDEVVRFASGDVINSYKDLIDKSCDDHLDQTLINQTFDILRRSSSLAINNDQELQTSLNVGGLRDILPKTTKYDNGGHSELNLERGIMEITITSPKIREIYREISDIRDSYDLTDSFERKQAADEIAEQRKGLLSLRKEIISDDQRQEWIQAKEYLKMEVGILDGEQGTADGSADKLDVAAVLGQAVEKISAAAEKMAKVVKKINSDGKDNSQKDIDDIGGYELLNLIKKETDVNVLTNIARKNLDYIEGLEDASNRYRLTGQPTDILDHITNKLKTELIPEAEKTGVNLKEYELLRKEIRARLTIFDIGKFLGDVSFRITESGRGGIGDMIDQASKIDRTMDTEVLKFCFKESAEVGFNIAGAWNYIQEANFNYKKILGEIWESGYAKDYSGGRDKFLKIDPKMSSVKGQDGGLFMDGNGYDPERAGIVDKYIISKLGNNGKKAYELANELADATAETSTFNFGFINGDNNCEVIYFRDYRNDDASKGKKMGPFATRGIESLAHGWLRYFSRSTDLTDKMGPIKAEEVLVDKAIGKKNSSMYFGKVLSSYTLSVKNALMESDPDPKKILNLSNFQELVGSFDKVDPPYEMVKTTTGWRKAETPAEKDANSENKSRGGVYNMKAFYVLGLLEIFATKENIGWDTNAMSKFKEVVLDTQLSETKKSFINETQWKWILEQKIAHDNKGNSLTYIEAMRLNRKSKFTDYFWDYFANGGKKGK